MTLRASNWVNDATSSLSFETDSVLLCGMQMQTILCQLITQKDAAIPCHLSNVFQKASMLL